MSTDLAKDFNYILHYFGIKTRVYEPARLPDCLAFRGWHIRCYDKSIIYLLSSFKDRYRLTALEFLYKRLKKYNGDSSYFQIEYFR
jgi:hypothetical protein